MADFLSSNSMLMLERAMNFQWTKQRAITDNVVNAETPDYKTKYVTFEEALRKNIWAAAQRGAPLASMREAKAVRYSQDRAHQTSAPGRGGGGG